jgi:hypothetical protein
MKEDELTIRMRHAKINRLKRTAEIGGNEESFEAMTSLKKLNPTYHYCAEWDYAVICDIDPEWSCCICDIKLKPQKQ